MQRMFLLAVVAFTTCGCAEDFNPYAADLNNLKTLTARQADQLVKARWEAIAHTLPSDPGIGVLAINGLNSISPSVAQALSKHVGPLSLDGLTDLSPRVAQNLSGYGGSELSLNGLKKLSPEAAKELGGYRGRGLFLSGLMNISPEVIERLLESRNSENGYLNLGGLRQLTPEVAQAFTDYKGRVIFCTSHFTFDGDTLKGESVYAGLSTLSDEAAAVLAKHRGGRDLSALTDLSPQAAATLRANRKIILPARFQE